ncbi:hypothetical protein [Myxosarcina sp. GI1(2024)]
MIKFNYFPNNLKPNPVKTLFVEDYKLEPGINEANDSLANAKGFKRLVESGVIELIQDKPKAARKTPAKVAEVKEDETPAPKKTTRTRRSTRKTVAKTGEE